MGVAPTKRASRSDGSSDDFSLVQRSTTEPEAFRVIWERHHDALARYLGARVGADAAEDLLIDTFETAFRKRCRFRPADPSGTALPWLYGIATLCLQRQRRAESKWLRRLAAQEQFLATGPHRELSMASQTTLMLGIEGLPKKLREPFLLAILSGLDYEEVAVALSIPVGTVRSRINRARKRLQEQVDRGES